ncbi:hypothetical protein V1477_010576, partial [Vespula maculifrons]
ILSHLILLQPNAPSIADENHLEHLPLDLGTTYKGLLIKKDESFHANESNRILLDAYLSLPTQSHSITMLYVTRVIVT